MPKHLTTPFASEATSEYRTDVQNSTGAEPNSATYEQGFPPVTMEKIAMGGKPPKGSDLNGVLYDITDNLVSLTKGARYGFNEAYATAIGGYPKGAVLRLENGVEVESEVDSNSINPNVDMTGWKLAISDKGIVTWSGRTQEAKNKDEISILDFGNNQLNLGLIDASAYFVLASIYAYTYNKTINLNGGKYLVEKSCLLKPCLFEGNGAEISIKNNVVNFEFEESEKFGVVVGFSDCSIKLLESTGTVIKTPKNSSQYLTNQTKLNFKDLYFYGTNKNTDKYASAFDEVADAYIDLGDALGCTLMDIGIFGGYDIKQDPENQVKSFGIKTSANGALMTARCSNIEVLCCYTGIEFGAKTFFGLTGFDIAGAHIGIDASNSESFNEPNIYFGNVNAQHIGIKTSKSSKDINNVTIRRHRSGWKGADWDWYGIYDEGGSDLNVSKNTLHVDENEGVFNGISYGIYALNTSLSNINENYISDALNVGICLDNTTGINSINTITAQNKSTASVYSLKNNARRYTITNIQEVSSFTGTHITKDSTVLPTSLNYVNTTRIKENYGTGNINEDTISIGANSGNKRWRTVTTTTAKNSQVASDDGSSGVNYDLITRNGTTVTNRELRSKNLYLNATLKIKNPPTFADNDAAKTGGLVAEDVYRTSTGVLMVVY